MKYYEVEFTITPTNSIAQDVLSALLAEVGFEAFESTDNGLNGYVQQQLWDEKALKECINSFPLSNDLSYIIKEVPDEDWNQKWEEEGFEPIVLEDKLCIHDTKHTNVPKCQYDIVINPRMAFGTGTHPTTQMILQTLLTTDLNGKNVIDAGCGTGVLGIIASKRGANEILAFDIDEWSTENATTNFKLNNISNATIMHGDASVLSDKQDYDILIANINRNILLHDMQRYISALRKGGELILSGFYTSDVQLLVDKAASYGLAVKETRESSAWCLLRLG